MAPPPWNPRVELDGALDRGNLSHAVTLAAEVAEDGHQPVDLDTALRFSPRGRPAAGTLRRVGAPLARAMDRGGRRGEDRASSRGRRAACRVACRAVCVR